VRLSRGGLGRVGVDSCDVEIRNLGRMLLRRTQDVFLEEASMMLTVLF
jgi:hypothetical protein